MSHRLDETASGVYVIAVTPFTDAGLIDEFVLYLAPVLLGSGARALFAMPPVVEMGARRELDVMDVRAVGNDWRLTARLK